MSRPGYALGGRFGRRFGGPFPDYARMFSGGVAFPLSALNLDFLASEVLDPRITASGGVNATRVNNAGVIVAKSAPRFDYDPVTLTARGLLAEEARTNLFLRNAELDNAFWTKGASSIAANTTISPAGTLTGDKLVEDTSNGAHFVTQSATSSAATNHSFSIYAKAAGRSAITMQLDDGGTSVVTANYDLTAVALGSVTGVGSATISDAGGGWRRCTVTGQSPTTNIRIVLYLNNGVTIGYTGDGTSGVALWGGQIEVGNFSTSLIMTLDTPVARTTDVLTVTGANFTGWFVAGPGSVACDFAPVGLSPTAADAMWIILGASGADSFQSRAGTIIAGSDAVITAASVASFDTASRPLLVGRNGSALGWSAASGNYAVNGTLAGAPGAATLPTVTQLWFGQTGTGNKWLRRFRYWSSRLTDAQLQQASV